MSWRESDFVVGACGGAVDLATANDTTARLQRIRRKAQGNFQFATIYEQRKTREILVAGYLPGTGRDFRRVTSGRPLRVRPRSQASIGPKVHHVAAGCLDRIALGVGLEPLHQRNKFALCATPRSRSSSPRLRRAALHSADCFPGAPGEMAQPLFSIVRSLESLCKCGTKAEAFPLLLRGRRH